MDQDDVNEQFQAMAFRSLTDDVEVVMEHIIALESRARHEVACNGDGEAAGRAANEAYALYMSLAVKEVPTLVMALADRFNRERELVHALLDAIEAADHHLSTALESWGSESALPHVRIAVADLAKVLQDAPYERDFGDE